MKQWWQNLTDRERYIVIGSSSLLIIILFYLFIWAPFTNNINNLRIEVNNNQNLLTWMQQATHRLKTLQQIDIKVQKTTKEQLLTVIDQSLKAEKLDHFSNQIKQTQENKVSVEFQAVPFDEVIAWLTKLWQKNVIKTDQITITPNADKAGEVQAQITLAASN